MIAFTTQSVVLYVSVQCCSVLLAHYDARRICGFTKWIDKIEYDEAYSQYLSLFVALSVHMSYYR